MRPARRVGLDHVVVRHENDRRELAVFALPQKRDAVGVDHLKLAGLEDARIQAAQLRHEFVERRMVGIGVGRGPDRLAAQNLAEALDRLVGPHRAALRQRIAHRRRLQPHGIHRQHNGQHNDQGRYHGKHEHAASPPSDACERPSFDTIRFRRLVFRCTDGDYSVTDRRDGERSIRPANGAFRTRALPYAEAIGATHAAFALLATSKKARSMRAFSRRRFAGRMRPAKRHIRMKPSLKNSTGRSPCGEEGGDACAP